MGLKELKEGTHTDVCTIILIAILLTTEDKQPWPGSSGGYSIVPISQGCGFDLRSEHRQEPTSECNVSLSLSFPLSKINKIKEKEIKDSPGWCGSVD